VPELQAAVFPKLEGGCLFAADVSPFVDDVFEYRAVRSGSRVGLRAFANVSCPLQAVVSLFRDVRCQRECRGCGPHAPPSMPPPRGRPIRSAYFGGGGGGGGCGMLTSSQTGVWLL
jgi:hypothetical protein